MEKIFDLSVANPVASKAIEACLRVFYREEEKIPKIIYDDWYAAIIKGSLIGLVQQIEPMYAYLLFSKDPKVAEALGAACHVTYRYNTLHKKDRAFDIMNKCSEYLEGNISDILLPEAKYMEITDA